ncbi:uncharacterized protein LOC108629456 isoform X2 [Ceratina calcarata]|uniref:Uncharacterized protein LOC108629456 isoform X2 n=1 Tax=Ceratina calcarata TaxID=156304 RepID=A0AAJ7S926_9HYME|nr:uncharacterized protein LOC108629456 isoform X2 [Ceratina calcarata]
MHFSWGNIDGLDTSKIKCCVCPEHGEVPANNVKEVEITFTPLKEGIVQSFFVPCFVDGTRKMIMLGIECSIEPLYVTFYFPTTDDDFQLRNNFVRVEWRVDSIKLALNMAGKSRKYMKILDKYKSQEERELMTTNLDEGAVLRDASAGPSMQGVDEAELAEHSSASIRTSEVIQMSNLTGNDNYSLSPFYDTFLPAPTQPVVIEFLNLPLNTVKKKTFIIKNETSIPSEYLLHIKNNYPIKCTCEWKNQKDRIRSIYKRTFGRDKKLIEEALFKMKQHGSGIVIYVDPLHSDLEQFKAIPIDIYVFADTWGIYVDEIEINITGLPQYTIGICVQVVGSPISLSISDRNELNIPVVKYGTESVGIRLPDRQIQIKNTSVIPIVIDWHTFIVKPVIQEMPFNIAFNVLTPFTDKLSMKLRTQSKTDSEVHMEKHKYSPLKKNLHACNSTFRSDTDFVTTTQVDSSLMALSTWSFTDNTSDSCVEHLESTLSCTEEETFAISDATAMDQTKQMELRISLLPFYGSIDTKICKVTPREMFILPKASASLEIRVRLDKYRIMHDIKEPIEGEFLCKLLGFVRIAPSDMYKDNNYARQAGDYLPPIEIDVTANIVAPKLDFYLSREDRTFTCCASDVMQSRKKILRMTKTFFLYNTTNKMIDISLETCDPFQVKSVFLYADTNPCRSGTMCVNGRDSM